MQNSIVCSQRQSGFTLLELMTAILVGSILLTVGIPSFTTVVKNANIIGESNGFLADLHFARDLAITRNRRVVVCPSATGQACDGAAWTDGRIVFVDEDADGARDAAETIERVADELSDLVIQPFQFANSVTYRPNGRAMGAAVANEIGAFLVCDDRGADHARALIIDFGGRPRVTHLASMGIVAPCPAI